MNNLGGTPRNHFSFHLSIEPQSPENTHAAGKTYADPVTPEEVWDGWMSRLSFVVPEIEDALDELAHGRLANDGCVQTAFQLLLAAEAYDTCLEIFEAHRAVREAAAGEPIAMALDLDWPADWNPDREKLEALFQKLGVDSLTVDTGASTLPEAGCHCIAILLKNGLKKLAIGGSLAAPEVVAKAFKSSSLRSIEFLGAPLPRGWTIDRIAHAKSTVGILVDGLADHTPLESLAIHDERLLELHDHWNKLQSLRLSLCTLELSLKVPDFKDDAWDRVHQFLSLVKNHAIFSNITLTCGPRLYGLDAESVDSAILLPLKGHPRLTSLSLCHMPSLTSSPGDLKSQAFAMKFARSCPRLSRFAWEATSTGLTVDVLREFCHRGGNLLMTQYAAKIANDSVELLPRMEKMALTGHPVATGTVQALVVARGDVGIDARMDLDLTYCVIDVKEAIALAAAWKKGRSSARLRLPSTLDRYYLREGDKVWGIADNAVRDGFVLTGLDSLVQADRDLGNAAFNALKPAFLEMMREIRQQLVQDTSPFLENGVQAFMQAALHSAYPNVPGVSNDAFSLPAKAIVEQLVKEERTPTLVHLSAVNAHLHKLRPQGPRRQDIAHLVGFEKDRHAELMAAVEAVDFWKIVALLQAGVVDIGGRAHQRARQLVAEGKMTRALLSLFEERVPKLSPAAPGATTTTTASVTTAHTTTTTTISTAISTRIRSTSELLAELVNASDQPERWMDPWKAWAPRVPPDTPEALSSTLRLLAEGTLSEASEMQPVFLHLIERGTFDLFEEVFNTYNDMQRVAAKALHCPPFRSSLVLKLPHDWAPDVARMTHTLQRIQVDTLTLEPTGSIPHLSYAAGQLVATLIGRGTTELTLGGVPSFAKSVADAMPRSQLRALTLLGVPQWYRLPEAETKSFETLASSALGCTTLQEVSIRDEKLFTPCLELLYAGPQLTTLEVPLGIDMDHIHTTHFMRVASGLPALSRVKVHFDVITRFNANLPQEKQLDPVALNRVQAAIFTPLAMSKTLTTLDLGPMPMPVDSPMCTGAAPSAFVFAVAHPSLQHLSWKATPSQPLTVQHLQAFKAAGGHLDMVDISAQIAAAHAKTGSNLEVLSLSGFVLPPGPTQAWAATLASSLSLRRVDLSGCLMDARTAAALHAALQQNPLIERIAVSTNYSHYYFSFEGEIWAIRPKNPGDGFELTREGEPDEALDKRVALAFAEVKEGLRGLIASSLAQTLRDAMHGQR